MNNFWLILGVIIAILLVPILDIGYAFHHQWKIKRCIAEIQSTQKRLKLTDFQLKQIAAYLFSERVSVKSDGSLDLSNLLSYKKVSTLLKLLRDLENFQRSGLNNMNENDGGHKGVVANSR